MNSDASFNREEEKFDSSSPVTLNQRKSSNVAVIVLGAGLVALGVFSVYQNVHQNSQVADLSQELTAQKDQTAAIQNQLASQSSTLSGSVNDLQAQLSDSQAKTSKSIAKAEDLAQRHAEVVAGKVQQSLEQSQEAINAELTGVKSAAADTATQMSSKIDGVGASVDGVKTDLASTKAMADKTATDLQRATGDMGVMSGLIATNGKQIEELRALGDRNIYEFTITKKSGLQKVGDVQVRLTKADPKHGRYNLAVMSNDKLVEKRDKTTNEPVQFYTDNGGRTPDELVVNVVGKDTIKGYLATPKIATARK